MNKTEILIISGNEELQTVMSQINDNAQWSIVGVSAVEEAIEKFHQHLFDVVVLADGISNEEERKLRKLFTHQNPGMIIMQHNGGPIGLLLAEIREALDKRQQENKPTVSFTDDALKNAGLNIIIQ